MNKQRPDIDRIKAAILYVLNKVGETDYHKLFKILYFADQKHLVRFGREITGDQYVAMDRGPVPSETYDLLKHLAGMHSFLSLPEDVAKQFSSFNFRSANRGLRNPIPMVSSNEAPDLDELSASDIDCLSDSIAENKNLSFFDLTEKSHDDAWDKARAALADAQIFEAVMEPVTIAQAGSASQEMLQYITENLAFNQLVAASE